MSINIFPEPTTSSINSNAYTVANPLYQYKAATTLTPGIYTITTYPTSSIATISGYDESGNFLTVSTSGGTVSWNITSTVANPFIYTNTGSDVIVTITLTAAPLTGSAMSGTLDTITSTSTYNQTGRLYVVAVGAGAGGGSGFGGAPSSTSSGGGGAGGGITGGFVITNAPTSITIGAPGNGATQNTSPNAGGNTTFGNYLTAGGGSGLGVNGSTPWNDARGGARSGNVSGTSLHSSVKVGTTGSGGEGRASVSGTGGPGEGNGGLGAGSGVGTGGTGGGATRGTPPTAGNGSVGNGYGAGGGGGGAANQTGSNSIGTGYTNGAAGTQGVVYVLRGF
jgi:hypothetical protein